MDLGISGRAAVVGGGSSGLGLASADRLAEAGCRLVIWARGAEALEAAARSIRERHGVEVHPVVADASDPSAASLVAEAATDLLGNVDILVLNAGGPPTVDPTSTDPDAWRSALQLLTLTPVELATRLMPVMRGRGWGRIVAILSYGVRQPIVDLSYSNAGRTALAAWLKSTSRSVAADGVTVNGVLPGRIETPRIVYLDRTTAERTGRSEADVRADHVASIPAGRYGEPDELGALVAYLCSEPARYQTGTFTAVDGGLLTGL